MERFAKDKHSSLLQKSITYNRKKFCSANPGSSVTKKKVLYHLKLVVQSPEKTNQVPML